jgi:5-hydroxyisourate hydrolase
MNSLSTHVLDLALGRPAPGIRVTLERDATVLGSERTDSEGRVREFVAKAAPLSPGNYRLTFFVAEYFSSAGRECFFPEIVVRFTVAAGVQHYHVPLLLSPFGYSVYRGS